MHKPAAVAVAYIILPVLALCLSGCGGEDANAPQKTAASAGSSEGGDNTPQAAVVRQFLEAAQKGDRETARGLMTAKSVQIIDQHELPFLAIPVDQISFRIGKTVKSGENYFVQCVSTDQDMGQSETLQWLVKKDTDGQWSIFGLAFYPPDQPKPEVINFEKADNLLVQQKQALQEQEAAQAAAAAGQGSSQQATRPQDPFQAGPR